MQQNNIQSAVAFNTMKASTLHKATLSDNIQSAWNLEYFQLHHWNYSRLWNLLGKGATDSEKWELELLLNSNVGWLLVNIKEDW